MLDWVGFGYSRNKNWKCYATFSDSREEGILLFCGKLCFQPLLKDSPSRRTWDVRKGKDVLTSVTCAFVLVCGFALNPIVFLMYYAHLMVYGSNTCISIVLRVWNLTPWRDGIGQERTGWEAHNSMLQMQGNSLEPILSYPSSGRFQCCLLLS